MIPDGTRVMVGIRPARQPAAERTAAAAPVRGDATNQFAALTMDHEGRFAVHVAIDGPLGAAMADAAVDATYNVRPSRSMLACPSRRSCSSDCYGGACCCGGGASKKSGASKQVWRL